MGGAEQLTNFCVCLVLFSVQFFLRLLKWESSLWQMLHLLQYLCCGTQKQRTLKGRYLSLQFSETICLHNSRMMFLVAFQFRNLTFWCRRPVGHVPEIVDSRDGVEACVEILTVTPCMLKRKRLKKMWLNELPTSILSCIAFVWLSGFGIQNELEQLLDPSPTFHAGFFLLKMFLTPLWILVGTLCTL